MKRSIVLAGAALALSAAVGGGAHAATITKSPDLGAFWQPLRTTFGSYVYADSFVAPISGSVTDIGVWLVNHGGDTSAQPIAFEVLGSAGGGGPDHSQVLATTGTLTLDVTGPLSLYSAATTSSASLVAGQTYWVAADEVGLSGGGKLQAGGHTQNSGGITDNGAFFVSNDPTGSAFTGGYTPEMAFAVTLAAGVPEPATWAMMMLGLFGLGAVLRSNRRRGLAAAA